MKGSMFAAAAAIGGAEAANLHHRHAHPLLKKDAGEDNCVCETVYETVYGEPTLVGIENAAPYPTVVVEETVVPVVVEETEAAVAAPTPKVEVCETPGTYTFEAETLTLTETTTVCGATSTRVAAGEHTLGGVTTIVETETTVVCPYATTSYDDSGVVTSLIMTTTYVCPSAGTYTIAPVTTSCAEEADIVLPEVEVWEPGKYTRPAVTTTIVDTSVVVVCPYTMEAEETPTYAAVEEVDEAIPTPAAEVEEVEVEDPVATYVPEIEEAAVVDEVEETTTAEVEAAATSVSTESVSIGSSGDHWAMTYTPYTDDSLCKSQSQIDSDIASIAAAGFTAVRVYSTDCDTLPYIGGACIENGLQIVLGIFVSGSGCTNSNPTVPEQIAAIAEWAEWDNVETIVVGNEAIFNGYCTASEISGLISDCKSSFTGYSGSYTTAETLNIWQESGNADVLCDAIDVVGANIHPYFNSEVVAEDAGTFVLGQLELVDAICPGKSGINLECGWPSAGECIGTACPGEDNQVAAISDIRDKVGSRTCFFSFTNDLWKEAGSCNCEQSWGCGSLF